MIIKEILSYSGSTKYLNNSVEQDHRFIKKITKHMMGFKAVHSASATLSGIETAHMIRKGQFTNNLLKLKPAVSVFYLPMLDHG